MSIPGIDVSHHQGDINWSEVYNSGVRFAMIRASYGTTGLDKKFVQNYNNAKASGVLIGSYHYCYAMSVDEAKQEANHFLDTIKGLEINYPIVLDIEDPAQQSLSKSTVTDMALEFLKILAGAGYYAMIYSSKYWFENVLDDSRLKDYDHWVAQWASRCTYSGATGIWQYSDSGSVKGIQGAVDMNTANKDYEAIIKENGLNNLPQPAMDNTPDPYAKAAVDKAVSKGIIRGDDKGDLHLHEACIRQDVLVILNNAGLL